MKKAIIKQPHKANKFIYLTGELTENKTKLFMKKLWDLEMKNDNSDIIIFINSYGGDIYSFITMHDAIRMCRSDVATVCIGKAMSAAQMLLISGTKGKRFITKNSSVMMHELSMEDFNGKIKEINIELIEGKKIQAVLNNLILSYTSIDKEYLQTIMSKDSYFNSKECLQLGIVDHIISKPEDFYSRIKL